MKEKNTEKVIGYSGFDLIEECYGYNENACYIADTRASAYRFIREAAFGGEYRVELVTLSRIMDDFGYSLGEFAMEKQAFERFRAAADAAGIGFQAGAVDFSSELALVNLDRIRGFNAVNLRLGYPMLEIRSPLEVWKDDNEGI